MALATSIAACAGAMDATASPLQPPPGYLRPAAALADGPSKDRTCEELPAPYSQALDFPSRYEGSDAARDEVNASAEAEYTGKTASITTMEKEVARLTDLWLEKGDHSAADCAIAGLAKWADARGMEGEAANHTGVAVRKWTLGSFAGAYLKLKFSSSNALAKHPDEARRIEAWLGRIADRVVKEMGALPPDKINNHRYWAAWSVMAVAVIDDRRDLYDWSVASYRFAAGQVDKDGFLPNELKRETRALHYHDYSLAPLAMIAAFAKANGMALAPENNAAIVRLSDNVLAGLDDPKIFSARAGAAQDLSALSQSTRYAWLEPYCWTRTCTASETQRLATARPVRSTRLGGNLTAVFSSPSG